MSVEIVNRREWENDLRRAAVSIGVDVLLVQKKLALDIFGDVVAGTPVLTGRAMNNWNISVGTADVSITDVGGSKSGIESDKQSAALIALSQLSPFQTIWLSNSLPYIGFLEEGNSDQAPDGWVERAVENNLRFLG